MPIYEYLCESCGKVNEQLQKVNDPPPARCDECGSRKLAKLVSRSAFQLKGGGWYSDLYASKKEKAAPSKDGTDGKDATAAATAAPAEAGRCQACTEGGACDAGQGRRAGEEGEEEGRNGRLTRSGLPPATWAWGPACPSRTRHCRRTWRRSPSSSSIRSAR
jgi:putative FmdB family regulatory protein